MIKIGVVHPVESYWLHWGPAAQTQGLRGEMDERFSQLIDWLLFNQLDFDYICESLLPSQYDPDGEGFAVGEMHYGVIIAPWLETIRSTTLEALKRFADQGGKVIFAGDIPSYIDGAFDPRTLELLSGTVEMIPWSKTEVLNTLEPYRLHSITEDGVPAENIFSQWREDNGCRWLFSCHVHNSDRYYTTQARNLTIRVKGEWRVQKYDTLTGDVLDIPVQYQEGHTEMAWHAYPQDSVLLRLTPGKQAAFALKKPKWRPLRDLPFVLPVTLSEPNVLVLDMPEHALDGGAWQPKEEILRICDQHKEQLGYRNEIAEGCQPWVMENDPDAKPIHTVRLRYAITSRAAVDNVRLGAEDLNMLKITWNGVAVGTTAEGHYVDEAIQTVTLGALRAGENVLEIEKPFGKVTTLENCFLLGDFGVEVRGREAAVTQPVRELAFGSWVHQGLPFYGGNVTYHAAMKLDHTCGNALALEAPHFNLPVLGVSMDDGDVGIIAISPYRVDLGRPSPGTHTIGLTAYGNRINTFGALHNCNYAEGWYGPGAWRSRDNEWSYEYMLKPCGVMKAPVVLQLQCG